MDRVARSRWYMAFALAVAMAGCLGMLVMRASVTGKIELRLLVWNLFLAAVPRYVLQDSFRSPFLATPSKLFLNLGVTGSIAPLKGAAIGCIRPWFPNCWLDEASP